MNGMHLVERISELSLDDIVNWGSRAVWSFPSVRANDDHEAKFPLELPRRCIRLLTEPGDVVLDCFIGSGTTAVAAILEGRRYMGIELMPEYVRMAKRACLRASQAVSGMTLEEVCGESVVDGQQLPLVMEFTRCASR